MEEKSQVLLAMGAVLDIEFQDITKKGEVLQPKTYFVLQVKRPLS
jgi:hypothetical protein